MRVVNPVNRARKEMGRRVDKKKYGAFTPPDLPINVDITFRNDSIGIGGINFLKTKYYDKLLANAQGFDGFFPRFTLPKTSVGQSLHDFNHPKNVTALMLVIDSAREV